ncbi:MAG: TonB-dependent receptor [Oleiphilaceae bacterium]|nr:TonB-dependent receptor [Oleiphilaceae bacterium]
MRTRNPLYAAIVASLAASGTVAEESQSLGSVVITGEKIERSLQDTTTSVQVFDAQDMKDSAKMDDLYDVFEQTSNVTRTGEYGFNIRGISTSGSAGTALGPRTIDVSVDGVSQGLYAGKEGGISTWDVEQIEILKGPQSTTQGRNSMAGTVIVKMKKPEFESNGAVRAKYATANSYDLALMQTGGITDNLAYRITAEGSHSDGHIENDILDKEDFDAEDITNVRGKLLYQTDSDAEVLLTVSKNKYDDDGAYTVQAPPFDRKSDWNQDGFFDTESESHSLDISVPISDELSFKSVTGFSKEEFHRFSDWDALAGDATIDLTRKNDNIAQEFRLDYNTDNLKSTFGLFYSNGDGEETQAIDDLDVTSIFGVGGLKIGFGNKETEEFTNTALFFNADYDVTDSLTVIVGARVDQDERENTSVINAARQTDYSTDQDALVQAMILDNGTLNPAFASINDEPTALATLAALGGVGGLPAGVFGVGTAVNGGIDAQLAALATGQKVTSKNDNTTVLPKLGFDYDLTDTMSTGVVYSKGYRPGGISVNPTAISVATFDEEYTDNYELHFRSTWLDERLLVNTNIYYTDWKDQQVQRPGASGTPFDFFIVNAGKSTLTGIEIEAKYAVTDMLEVFAAAGYQKSEYKEYETNPGLEGNEFSRTPRLNGNVGATQRFDGGTFVSGNVSMTGSSYDDDANTRKVSGRAIANLKTGYEQESWGAYAFVNNLLDKDYILSDFGNQTYEVGAPREIGVELSYNW